VQSHLSAIAARHRDAELDCPITPAIRQAAKGLQRLAALSRDRSEAWREPFDLELLKRFVDDKPERSKRFTWLRDAALVAIGIRTMRRASELVALRRKHVKWLTDGSVRIFIRHSKTDQLNVGFWIPVEPTKSKYCPVRLLKKFWAATSCRQPDEPLFCNEHSAHAISVAAVTAVVRRIYRQFGNPARVSSHSLRLAGANLAMGANLSLSVISAIGGWRSKNTAIRYLRASSSTTGSISASMGF